MTVFSKKIIQPVFFPPSKESYTYLIMYSDWLAVLRVGQQVLTHMDRELCFINNRKIMCTVQCYFCTFFPKKNNEITDNSELFQKISEYPGLG
jgi:hypothetical protein